MQPVELDTELLTMLSLHLGQSVDLEFLEALVEAKKRFMICELENGKAKKLKISKSNAARIEDMLTLYRLLTER